MEYDLSALKINLLSSCDDVAPFVDWLTNVLNTGMPLAFDTETTGLDLYAPNSAVRLVQFGSTDACWAIPMDGWRRLVDEVFNQILGDFPLIAHNAKFDINWLYVCEGIDATNGMKRMVHDTMLYSHLVYPHQSHALKSLSKRYVSSDAQDGQMLLQKAFDTQGWDWSTVPVEFPLYWSYGALDTSLTAMLFESFNDRFPQIRETRSYEIEMSVMPIFAAMERYGARIDVDYVAAQSAKIINDLEMFDAYVKLTYGLENRNSAKQLADALIREGVELTVRTPSGQYALDADVLQSIDHPLAQSALSARKSQKVLSTYFANLCTPFVHPDIRQCGAATGRSSVTKPALQTIPRGTMVRDAFIPREGNKLVSCDLDQVEMRILAEFCRDPNLINAINTGDLHTATMRLVYNDPTIPKSDPRRQTTKNAGFAKVYRAGVEQFARTAGITVEAAQTFLNLYDTTFPGVESYANKLIQESKANGGAVTSPFGRVQRLKDDRDYAIINYLIQGTAAEVFKLNVIALWNSGFHEMIVPVHDEIIMEIPDDEDQEDALRTIEECMTYTKFAVPLTASGGLYDRWGDKYR